jgi:hypothetical protein
MRRLFTFCLLLLGWLNTQAQTLTTNWMQSYPTLAFPSVNNGTGNGHESHLFPHPNGGYVIVSNWLKISHTDNQGVLIRSRNVTLPSNRSFNRDLKYTHDAQGNILVTGGKTILKATINGDTLWTRTFPGPEGSREFSTKMVTAPDGNCVMVYQYYRPSDDPRGGVFELHALKLNGMTGQIIWDTSLTPLVASIVASFTSSSNYFALEPALERRASGYFVFLLGSGTILLSEDGTTASLRSGVPCNPRDPTLYSRTNTTIVSNGNALFKLDDQGNTLKTGSRTAVDPNLASDLSSPNQSYGTGYCDMIEDDQNNIITSWMDWFHSGPGGFTTYSFKLRRVSFTTNIPSPVFGFSGYVEGQFRATFSPTGEYVILGRRSSSSSTSLIPTLTNVSSFTPLAAKTATISAGSLGLYPNPASARTSITVTLPTAAPSGHIGIYDVLGRAQGPSRAVSGSSVALPLPQLAAGLYVVRFTSPEGHTWTNRLTVQ